MNQSKTNIFPPISSGSSAGRVSSTTVAEDRLRNGPPIRDRVDLQKDLQVCPVNRAAEMGVAEEGADLAAMVDAIGSSAFKFGVAFALIAMVVVLLIGGA